MKACRNIISYVKKRKPIPFSINAKITFFLLCLIIGFLSLFMIIAYQISSKILVQETIDSTNQNFSQISNKLELIFNETEELSELVVTNSIIQQYTSVPVPRHSLEEHRNYQEVKNVLSEIKGTKDYIDSIMIFANNGLVYDSGEISVLSKQSPITLKQNSVRATAWKGVYQSNYTLYRKQLNIVSFFQRFNSERTALPLGTIQINLRESWIRKQYNSIDFGQNGNIFIVNHDGKIVSHHNPSNLYQSIKNEPYFSFIKQRKNGQRVILDDREYLVVSQELPKLNWALVALVPIENILAVNKPLMKSFLLIGFIMMASVVLITLLISNLVSKPLKKINHVVKEVQNGNLDVSLDINSRDEIGVLAKEFNKMVRRTKRLMEKVVKEQEKKRKYALISVQSQLNPHFLYNTLENICGLAEMEQKKEVIELTHKLADFYRGVISKGNQIISMEEEMLISKRYLEILSIRYKERLAYKFIFNPEIFNYQIVKLSLQPIIENAIRHNLKDEEDHIYIEIIGEKHGDKIHIFVNDHGEGTFYKSIESLLKEKEEKGTIGFGLYSSNERIKQYFGEQFGIKIHNNPGKGTSVEIIIPAIRQGEIAYV
ncbi:histidine kinase [Paenibacillus sp. BSR1-1]|uniref:cache domain-containing sensor histidine kinase n=1 Tax=Paenibacillus sp. BSR1-1 TaxID=3020845 RepID=UPI0025B08DE5|nr:histidine kinase [Paenibacillus sp. BSR1-1]MDN3020043.1 histidine kinase [Paenibacillus sp. BSR1-1]